MSEAHRYMPEQGVEITASALSVTYENFLALKVNELQFHGNVIAVIGHNGAGKSTLIKSLLGLLPYEGRLDTSYFNKGSKIALRPEQHMAFCPETGAVFADISVESYVKLWCRFKHRDVNYYRKEGARYIEELKIEELFKKLGRELSKGQRRRVQSAIGFLLKPRFFLFDEPFDGLDVQKTNELTDIMRAHAPEMAFLVSSHRMDVMERLADSVIVLKEGEIVSHGSVDEVCSDLCKQTFRLSSVTDYEHMLDILKKEFPSLLINRLGDAIALTGGTPGLEELQSFVREHDPNGVEIREVKPSLIDAMNFHLREMV